MKRLLIVFLIMMLQLFLFAQKEYYYLRILHTTIENPGAVHLQGKIAGYTSLGFSVSGHQSGIKQTVNVSYFIKALKLGIQYKQQSEFYSMYKRNSGGLTFTKPFKIKKKGILAFGLTIRKLNYTLDLGKLRWADAADPVKGFVNNTNEIAPSPTIKNLTFDLGALFYLPVKKPLFAGFIVNDITQPFIGYLSGTGSGVYLPREIKIYGGQNLSLGKDAKLVLTMMYRHEGIKNQFIFKEDFIYKSKTWLGFETNFKTSVKISAGYLPTKKWRGGATLDIQPNSKSLKGNTNFLNLFIGHAV